MSDERWRQLEELFHAALPLDADARAAFLSARSTDDPVLHEEVQRLLDAHDRAADFIERPAVATLESAEADTAMAGRRIGPYRIVREIGRGGMGTVYLAERADGAFTQRVAIKLVKRGMDTDQVLARFRAERQILASLGHPNIARLLDGGTTDDGLPYFAMEYVDGQPIDVFAGANRLTLRDRILLFLQVCDAVAHAHGDGVIHRDIKPLNIVVTPAGVVKLLDFGIAKVLQGAADADTSTVTGLRLLTPDYASPEQIEGRHATPVSDVYQLGVVLYELLTGRSPYRPASRAPQDIAAAVCTTDPEQPSVAVTGPLDGRQRRSQEPPTDRVGATGAAASRQLSRMLRGDLDTIVLTALRKEPARRYASVPALAEDLRRYLDGRPVLARPDAPAYRLGRFVRRNRTAVLAAGLAATIVGLLAGAGVALSRAEQTAEPSLLATRALAPRDRILVADFADRAHDATLAAAVTEAFRTDLAQSPVVRVLTPRQVRVSLEAMAKSPDVALDDSLAREVVLREGVKAFVTGSVAKVAGTYTVNAQLVAAQSGEALAAVRETAADSSRLIAAIDRASKALRRRIGESLRALEDAPPLERATTASLPALRKYTEGQHLARAGQRSLAIQRYEEAIAIDTGFASAHAALGMLYYALGDEGRAIAAKERALANQGRLSFFDRSSLVASAAYGREDYATAIRVYRALMERYPDNVATINNLALAYRDSRQLVVAESLYRLATTRDSTIAALYFGIHSAQVLRGDFAGSRATLDLVARRFPTNPVRLTVAIQDAAARQDWAEAERHARARITAAGVDTIQLVDPVEALAGLAMTQGRLGEAERLWRRQLVLSRAAGETARQLFGLVQLAYLELEYRSDTARARALVDSALTATPLDSLLRGDRPYDQLARFYAAAGDGTRARAYLSAAAANDRALGRTLRGERSWTRGVIALMEGRAGDARAELRQAAETHVCAICPLPDLARAYEAAGERDEAIAAYDRYLTTPWLWRYEPDAVALGRVTRRLAELYEEHGDRSNAARGRARLLALWGHADPPLRAR